MADDKNLTVYQKLFYMFGQNRPSRTTPKYSFGDGETITMQSQEDYNKSKLQHQQQNYLEAQWQRVDSELYQKAVYYETSRIASYMDYEAMEFTPEISAALDIMAEESCTPSEQGKVLTIQSNSKRVKNVLEDLFYNILDIQTNLPMWTRNTCKYGDNFVFMKIDHKRGIIGSSQLTNIEVERKEEGMFPQQTKEMDSTVTKKKQVTFHWRDKNMDFNPWEVAHFRLLGDDRRLPYGTSMLEKARRIW